MCCISIILRILKFQRKITKNRKSTKSFQSNSMIDTHNTSVTTSIEKLQIEL